MLTKVVFLLISVYVCGYQLQASSANQNPETDKIVQELVYKLESVKYKFQEGDRGLEVLVNDGRNTAYEANDPWVPAVLLSYFKILDQELGDNHGLSEKVKRLLIEETEDFWVEKYLPAWQDNYRRLRTSRWKNLRKPKTSAYEIGDTNTQEVQTETETEREREEIEGAAAWKLFIALTIILVIICVVVAIAVFVYSRRKKNGVKYSALVTSEDEDGFTPRRQKDNKNKYPLGTRSRELRH